MGPGPRKPRRIADRNVKTLHRKVSNLEPDVKVKQGKIPEEIRQKAPPLALLPLSIEYRFMQVNAPVVIKDTSALRDALRPFDKARNLSSLKARKKAATEIRQAIGQAQVRHKFVERKFTEAEELWLRWYPDESFSEEGVEPITEDEATARKTFETEIGGKPWWDMADAQVSAHWQHFANSVGAYRAVHLMRIGEEKGDDNYQRRLGRIAALPGKVALFAVVNGRVEPLAEGRAIPKNTARAASVVSYTPEAADPGGWLVDFETAVEHGMGIKIRDPETIKRAKAADWIIAIGLSGTQSRDELAALLKSHVATGEFSVIPQDNATNNSPDALSYLNRPEADLEGFTKRATAIEQEAYGAGKTYAADLLAEAFDLPKADLRRAVDGADTGFEDARAMLRVIGPALLDSALDGYSQVAGVSEDDFIEVMAGAIAARGVLPAVRFGENAMGVLPITKIHDFRAAELGQGEAARKVHHFLALYSRFNRAFLPGAADETVPVIQPADPDSADKLFDILSTTRVSKRLDVSGVGADMDKISGLGCPYVDGTRAQFRAKTYLKALREHPLEKLVDPDSRNRGWPLLYRLARLTLERNIKSLVFRGVFNKFDRQGPSEAPGRRDMDVDIKQVQDDRLRRQLLTMDQTLSRLSARSAGQIRPGNPALTAIDRDIIRKVSILNQSYAAALSHLETVAARPQGRAILEILLCEVVDLFQHRVDAFATGLAYARLKADRQAGQTGLAGGYYGFIGKLRPASKTGGSDGYIQAPTVPQALTAALLRSAYLRHRGGGAFEINLSSARTRRALKLLDLIAKGHDLREGLGLRGERWLHDNKHDTFILQLRARYPLQGERNDNIGARRVFDGLAFIADEQPQPLKDLRRLLEDDLDALSDVVMAEATHRRALGQADAANAWLQVLSGHPPPGVPIFLKTQRQGQGSSYRVNILMPEIAPDPAATPREIGEPGLAAFARRVLDGFQNARLEMSISAPDVAGTGTPPSTTVSMHLHRDLGMTPLDLVIGGVSEIQVRAKAGIARHLSQNPPAMAQFGALTSPAGLAFDVNLNAGTPSLEELLQRAELIRKTAKTGRSLDHGDLAASADIRKGELSEAEAITVVQYGIDALRQRIGILSKRMQTDLGAATNAISVFETEVLEARRRIDSREPQTTIDAQVARAEQHRAVLIGRFLEPLADYGAPEALRHFTTQEAIDDPEAVIGRLTDMTARIARQQARLAQAMQDHPASDHATLAEAKDALQGCDGALRQALDGEAMIILPPMPRTTVKLQPVFEPEIPAPDGLAPWDEHRPNVGRAGHLARLAGPLSAFKSQRAATIDPSDPQADPRPPEDAPEVRHHGTFLSTRKLMEAKTPVCGIVCDEWSVQRPSQTQPTGIAINYDSPQSEAPHAILLGVAPNNAYKSWTQTRAAELVLEAIDWMKIRALSSHVRAFPGAALPGSNVIAHKTSGKTSQARLPRQQLVNTVSGGALKGLSLHLVDTAGDLNLKGTTAAALFERRGFGVVKE